MLAEQSGIPLSTIIDHMKVRYAYNGRTKIRPEINTIRKLIAIEDKYRPVIKKFTRAPDKWDRSPTRNRGRMVPLKPIPILPPGVRCTVAILAPSRVTQDQKWWNTMPEWKKDKLARHNARRGEIISQAWARKRAKGWDWHEARKKIHAGRPYYNDGSKRSVDVGVSQSVDDNNKGEDNG